MDVSVIVPYHKRKELFLNQLDSLRRSDYPREKFEVILVEDGSEDFRRHDFGGEPIRMKYFWNEKLDPTCHTPLATGDRPRRGEPSRVPGLRPDRPSRLHRRSCRILSETWRRRPADRDPQGAASGSGRREPGDGEVRGGRARRSLPDVPLRRDGDGRHVGQRLVAQHIRSTEVRDEFRGFDEGFRHWGLEDQEFGLRMERNGAKIRYNPRVEVYHQHHKPAWGARVRAGWLGNYAHLVEKYPDDLRVKAIALLGEVLDPSMGIKIRIDRSSRPVQGLLHENGSRHSLRGGIAV